jgi:phosphopantothenoylcysteine decarboxylase/phosphopantothenate--cysteine ligase
METSSIPVLQGKNILLGVSGSIAAYKAVELASRLAQAGALVDVLVSDAAQAFVRPLTFQSVTGRRCYSDVDLWGSEAHVLHVGLAQQADVMLVAPATANTLAKLAHGQADTLLTITALAARCPLLVAPAMDAGMYDHPATQANLATLAQRQVQILGPASGHLASGLSGRGRMLEADDLVGHLRLVLGSQGLLAGKKIVVTAGGTQEALDPVRVLANRSSGKQGYALAQAALDRGAEVTLISGPVAIKAPVGAALVAVESAAQMLEAVLETSGQADALLMAAAVADFRPPRAEGQKIKRRGRDSLELKLEPTSDILGAVAAQRRERGRPRLIVGFAAESQDLVANARQKRQEHDLALIVANDISATDSGFAVDTNRVTLIDENDGVQALPLMSKAQVAEVVLDRLGNLLA